MIDPNILRTDLDRLLNSLRRRGIELDLVELIRLDERVRRTRQQSEEVRALQKEAGREIAKLGGPDKEAAIARVAQLAEDYKRLDAEAEDLAEQFTQTWATIPNLVDETAADGTSDADNQEIKRVGSPPAFDFAPSDFTTIGSSLDLVDMDRGAKVSGSRFGYLKGQAVLL